VRFGVVPIFKLATQNGALLSFFFCNHPRLPNDSRIDDDVVANTWAKFGKGVAEFLHLGQSRLESWWWSHGGLLPRNCSEVGQLVVLFAAIEACAETMSRWTVLLSFDRSHYVAEFHTAVHHCADSIFSRQFLQPDV
jgi:hypothetical protein